MEYHVRDEPAPASSRVLRVSISTQDPGSRASRVSMAIPEVPQRPSSGSSTKLLIGGGAGSHHGVLLCRHVLRTK